MKTIYSLRIFAPVLLGAILLASCGKNSATLTVDKAKINGSSRDYIEVVPGSYELKKSEADLTVPVKFRVLKTYGSDTSGANIPNIRLEILDGSGNPIDMGSDEISPSSTADWDKIKSLLASKPGDEATINFSSTLMSNEISKNLLENGKAFDIVSANITYPQLSDGSSSPGDNSSASNQTSVGGSEDWDKILDSYSSFVDQYIDLLKKAKAGDGSAASDYPDIMQKAQDLDEKLQGAQSNLSSSQAARLIAIEGKMTQAAADLSK